MMNLKLKEALENCVEDVQEVLEEIVKDFFEDCSCYYHRSFRLVVHEDGDIWQYNADTISVAEQEGTAVQVLNTTLDGSLIDFEPADYELGDDYTDFCKKYTEEQYADWDDTDDIFCQVYNSSLTVKEWNKEEYDNIVDSIVSEELAYLQDVVSDNIQSAIDMLEDSEEQ